MSNGFPRSPRAADCGDETINQLWEPNGPTLPSQISDIELQLVDKGFLAPAAETTPDHPQAARLFDRFKAGSNVLTKPAAYEIANELNRQAARIRELEGRLPACGLECDMPGYEPCEARSPIGLFCTQPHGHEGQHVACSEERHAIASWNDPPRPRDDTDERVDDALDAGEWPNEGGK